MTENEASRRSPGATRQANTRKQATDIERATNAAAKVDDVTARRQPGEEEEEAAAAKVEGAAETIESTMASNSIEEPQESPRLGLRQPPGFQPQSEMRPMAAPDEEATAAETDSKPAVASNSANQQQQQRPAGKTLQRKVSVFSFNGFPDIQLLDQENLNKCKQMEQSGRRITIAGSCQVKEQQQAISSESKDSEQQHATATAMDNKAAAEQGAGGKTKNKRSTRSDTLGSTGSSRASSCDEPTIVASAFSAAAARKQSTETMHQSSSNSSLESLVGWPTSGQLADGPSKDLSLDNKLSSLSLTTSNSNTSGHSQPPFESIKVQLKNNSKPNAQDIKRYIDNLISQNESIIDNCNLVSIRAYNSSRIDPGPSSTATVSRKESGDLAPMAKPISSGNKQRWSTTVLGNQATNCDTANGQLLLASSARLRQAPERKRSYNLTPRLQQAREQSLILQQYPIASALISPRPTVEVLQQQQCQFLLDQASQRRLSIGQPMQQQQQEPMQLDDDTIQNLSLKRSANQRSSVDCLQQQQEQQESHNTTPSAAARDLHRQQQQQQANLISSLNQELVAKLLLERQQQLQNFENQQQMIEQRNNLDQQLRLSHQQQNLFNNHLQTNNFNVGLLASIHATNNVTQQVGVEQPQPIHHRHSHIAATSYLREQQALESQLLRDYLSQMMPPAAAAAATGIINQQQAASQLEPINHNLQSITHGRELLTHSLDSAIPEHRCDHCDISFWTLDLLDYHQRTQCSARKDRHLIQTPIAFSFGSSATMAANNHACENPFDNPMFSKSASPPRRPQQISPADATRQPANNSSILKQQLLTSHSANTNHSSINVPHESLPFKKRKISEPNMRY